MLDRETMDLREIMAERDAANAKLSQLQDEARQLRADLAEAQKKMREQALAHRELHRDKAQMAAKIADLSRRLNQTNHEA